MKKRVAIALLLAGIAILAIHCFISLGRVPAYITDDDGGYASAAYQFWQTGSPGVPGYKDVLGLDHDVWAFGRIAAAVQGVFLKFFGISLFAALLPSYLTGLGLLGLTAALGNKLWDLQTGLLAALFLAASGKFFGASHGARPDILLTFFLALSLWLVASANEERPYPKLLLAGLAMALAGDVHLNGFLLAPAPLLFWFMLRPRPARISFRACLFYCGGGLLGIIYWYLAHVGLHPRELLHQAAVYGVGTHGVRVLKLGLWSSVEEEAIRYTTWFWSSRGHRHLFEGICMGAAGLWLLLKDNRVGRSLVCTWLAIFLIAALFMTNGFGWYLIYVWPLFALWMARFFRASKLTPWTQIATTILIAAYLFNLGLWDIKARKEGPLQSKLLELRRTIPAEAAVIGNAPFWFAFWDRDFTDSLYLGLRRLETSTFPLSPATGWREEQKRRGWRYIVVSDDLRLFLDPEVPLAQLLSAPAYLERRAEIREARSFSMERCEIERRIRDFSDDILVLRVTERDHDYVAR